MSENAQYIKTSFNTLNIISNTSSGEYQSISNTTFTRWWDYKNIQKFKDKYIALQNDFNDDSQLFYTDDFNTWDTFKAATVATSGSSQTLYGYWTILDDKIICVQKETWINKTRYLFVHTFTSPTEYTTQSFSANYDDYFIRPFCPVFYANDKYYV